MIQGIFRDSGEIFFPIDVLDHHGESHTFTALLDTGYTGFLTLTPEIIAALGLTFEEESAVRVGDGTVQTFRRYNGSLIWAGRPIGAFIHAVSGIPVVGTRALLGVGT